jgi:hypothetical protein
MPMFEGFRGLCMYFLVVAPNGLDDDNGGLDHKPVQSRSPVDGLTIKARTYDAHSS